MCLTDCSSYRGKVWFVLDVSENAQAVATSDQSLPRLQWYDVLREQLISFADDLTTGPLPQDVELGIVSFTGDLQAGRATARQTAPLTPVGTLANQLRNQQHFRLIPDGDLTLVSTSRMAT